MSDATAEVFAPDGTRIGWTTYQGSADCLSPGIEPDIDAAWEGRRKVRPGDTNPWDRLHACDHEPEDAIAFSHYGGEDHWPVKVCRQCRVITDRLSPYNDDWGYSRPTPEQQAADDAWLAAGWPKGGHPFPDATQT